MSNQKTVRKSFRISEKDSKLLKDISKMLDLSEAATFQKMIEQFKPDYVLMDEIKAKYALLEDKSRLDF